MKLCFISIRLLLISCVIASSSFLEAKRVNRLPEVPDPGLLITTSAVPLNQSDFSSGTLRITEPGYYYLAENIVFSPNSQSEATRTDKPKNTGWFTAISIETDNVVIDLNTKTLEASESFVVQQNAKVFSLIELNNAPFPTLDFGFTGETALISAHNVLIHNGTLGRSSHHGIHGNSNKAVRIHNLVVRDWEVAGIALNGVVSSEVKDVLISGATHKVPFTGLFSLLNRLLEVLEQLKADGDTGAQTHINAVEAIMNDPEQNGTTGFSGLPDGNMYGLYINRTLDVGPLAAHVPPSSIPGYLEQEGSESVLIENVTVANIASATIEVVSMEDSNGKVIKEPGGSVIRWQDAYSSNIFAPNDLFKAQVYAAEHGAPGSLPVGFAANILSTSPNESVFLSKVKPHFGGDLRNHITKGAFGIRLDEAEGVKIRNCSVSNLKNVGEKGGELSSISGGENYLFEEQRYKGADIHGVSLAGCSGCEVTDTSVVDCSSDNGFVFGIYMTGESSGNKIVNCTSTGHRGKLDNFGSTVNPSSQVLGVAMEDTIAANECANCVSTNLSSPRACCGFLASNTTGVVFKSCFSSGHRAFSSNDLDVASKYAVGFKSLGGICSIFKNCEAYNMHCQGEADYTVQSLSVAAGFLLEALDSNFDGHAVINECISRCHNGGSGKSVGIFLNGAHNADVTQNTVATSVSDTVFGIGFGIQDVVEDSISMILRNVAYGNITANYSVNYTDSKQSLPLSTALYNDVSNLHMTNLWNNISLELAPGKEFIGNTSRTTITIRQTITN